MDFLVRLTISFIDLQSWILRFEEWYFLSTLPGNLQPNQIYITFDMMDFNGFNQFLVSTDLICSPIRNFVTKPTSLEFHLFDPPSHDIHSFKPTNLVLFLSFYFESSLILFLKLTHVFEGIIFDMEPEMIIWLIFKEIKRDILPKSATFGTVV